jgi:hypothetical protein
MIRLRNPNTNFNWTQRHLNKLCRITIKETRKMKPRLITKKKIYLACRCYGSCCTDGKIGVGGKNQEEEYL